MAERDDELLAAYVDGVSELTPEERKRVESQLGELDVAGTRAMIDQLRALPPEGNEPDWRTLQARIGQAIDELPRPWWRRWFVPATGVLVVAAAALLVWLRHTPVDDATPAASVAVIHAPDAAVPVPVPAPVPTAQPNEIWLDGQLVDVSDVDPDAVFEDLDAPDALTAEDDGLLPATDLGWVDELDDHAMDRAEHWLEKKKS